MKSEEPIVTTSFRLPKKTHDAFKALAEKSFRTMGDHLNYLINRELSESRVPHPKVKEKQ